jgi:hypothetical protein
MSIAVMIAVCHQNVRFDCGNDRRLAAILFDGGGEEA